MGAIAIDTDQLRAIATFCMEDAAALRETRGAVERAWGVAGLPPTVQRLRPESDAPMHTASVVANELEDEAGRLRSLAARIDGVEAFPWQNPVFPLPAPVPFPWGPKTQDRGFLLPPGTRFPDDDHAHGREVPLPDPLWAWALGTTAGAWGMVQKGLDRIRELAKKAEEILAHLIAELTKLATGFVRTTDTMQRAVTHWLGDNVAEPILHFPDDWNAWVQHGEYRGIMGGLGRGIDWIGNHQPELKSAVAKLLLIEDNQHWLADGLLNAVPIFGGIRAEFRAVMDLKDGNVPGALWEAAGIGLSLLGPAALSVRAGTSALEWGVMTVAGKIATAVPVFQDLWTHRGDILRDIANGTRKVTETVKNWAKDAWGWATRAKHAAERIIEQGWDDLLKNFKELGRNFINATIDLGIRASASIVRGLTPFLPLLLGPPRNAPVNMRVPELVRDPGSGEPKWKDLRLCMPSSGALSRLDENYEDWHDSVVITRTADGKYVVYLRGVDPDKGGVLNSLSNAGSSRMGALGPYEQAVLKALDAAGVPRGAQVSIVAHSQGGIVAFNLAETPALRARVNVTHLLTVGSPVSADEIARAKSFNPGMQIMALDSRADGVTKTSIPDLITPREKHTFGNWLSRPGEVLGKNHDIVDGGYLAEYERSNDPDVKAFRESFERQYFTQPMEGEFIAQFK